MRLLVLYQATDPVQDHPGYYDGFERLVREGELETHRALGYIGIARQQGWRALWDQAYKAACEIDADAVFLHFFHTEMPDPSEGIRRLKNLPNHPIIFSSLGDPYGRWTKKVPRSFRAASALSDISFLTGMGYMARQLAGSGSGNLVLMPHGCCQVRFSGATDNIPDEPEFDTLFVGNRMESLYPLSHFYWVARKRVEFVAALTQRYGKRFALFGNGWDGNPSWLGPTPFASQQRTFQKSAVVLGGTPNAYYDYYTSDRVFIAAASGVPLVDYWIPGVDQFLEPGREWWLAHDIEETLRLCDMLLDMSSAERHRLAAATREHVLAHHTQYNRCSEMVEIARSLRQVRQHGRPAELPELKFLRNDSESGFMPDPIVGWRG